LNEHEDMRLQLAKSINEVEDQQARAEAELAAFKEDLRELEKCDPALEHERELTGTA
jgi:septal ring factor EnvC (AmiA/AmiB activator)